MVEYNVFCYPRSTAGGSQAPDFAEEISLHTGEMVGGGGEVVLMRSVNGPPSVEAAELLSLLGLQGSRKGEPKTELVSRSCAAAVDTVRRFEVALRTNSTTREPALTSLPSAGHTCIPSCVSLIQFSRHFYHLSLSIVV